VSGCLLNSKNAFSGISSVSPLWEITKYMVIYGVYIRFWPTLGICFAVGMSMCGCGCGGGGGYIFLGWPKPYICTVYDHIFGDIPAKNTV